MQKSDSEHLKHVNSTIINGSIVSDKLSIHLPTIRTGDPPLFWKNCLTYPMGVGVFVQWKKNLAYF